MSEPLAVRDPGRAARLVQAGNHRPCICVNGERFDTLEDAAGFVPPWARDYCISHGRLTPAQHDLERFPLSVNSYACDACKAGVHAKCQQLVRFPDWSHDCACFDHDKDTHLQVAQEARRDALAWVVHQALRDQKLVRSGGYLNGSVSYAVADAILAAKLG